MNIPLNYVDIGILIILLIFAVRGGLRGMVREVAGLIALGAGLLLARTFTPQLAEPLQNWIAPSAAPTVAFILLFLAGMIGVGLLARLLHSLLDFVFAGWLDHLLGIPAGLLKGALLCALLAWGATAFLPSFPELRDSKGVPFLLDFLHALIGSLPINPSDFQPPAL